MTTNEAIPATMRAALLLGTGGPEMLEVRDDVPVPRPERGDVLVQVAACGINNTDINTRVGWYSRSVSAGTSGDGFAEAKADDVGWGREGLAFPRIQGADIAGVVTAVGEGADDSLLGCRVLVDPWLRDRRYPGQRELADYLGSERDGGFAEYCAVPGENVYPISTGLSDVELASFACSWSTAEHMLARVGLGSAETIAVPGASGGVGSALVQLAKLRGARVVALAGASKVDRVLKLGADAAVVRETGNPVASAVEANGGPVRRGSRHRGRKRLRRLARSTQTRRSICHLRRHSRPDRRPRFAHPLPTRPATPRHHRLRVQDIRRSSRLYPAGAGSAGGRRHVPA